MWQRGFYILPCEAVVLQKFFIFIRYWGGITMGFSLASLTN